MQNRFEKRFWGFIAVGGFGAAVWLITAAIIDTVQSDSEKVGPYVGAAVGSALIGLIGFRQWMQK